MNCERIGIRGVVTVEVIDRETGKVKERRVEENTFTCFGAVVIGDMWRGQLSTSLNVTANSFMIDRILLGDGNRSVFKILTGVQNTATTGTGTYTLTFTVQDTSTDAYTVSTLGLSCAPFKPSTGVDLLYYSWFAQRLTTAVSKGSTDILSVNWTVTISCGGI